MTKKEHQFNELLHHFELTVFKGSADLKVVQKELGQIMGFDDPDDFNMYMVIDDDTLRSVDSTKWYDPDCAELSKRFPDVVFKLHGEGESTGDLWDSYYRNGMCQICRAHLRV